ncbi:MAG: ATP synthase F1 subunit delta [Phycisphaerae bacterium]|nr:ATP synthase F1 subunit delta [Phycisphaerae bacterium]
MPTGDDIRVAVARVYAHALLDLASAAGEADALMAELTDLLGLLDQDRDLADLFLGRSADVHARRAILEKLRGRMSDHLLNALLVLNDKDRLSLLRLICQEYHVGLERRRNEVDIHVTTAVPLPDRLRDRLARVAAELSGRKPRLVEAVDTNMIGGMVVRIEDDKYDVTVRRQLRRLRAELIDRAAREIHSGKPYFEDVRRGRNTHEDQGR